MYEVTAMTENTSAREHDFDQPRSDVVFSLRDGFVWASWPGAIASVRLGSQNSVTAVMRDFLAQCDLGDRLTNARADTKSSAG